VSVVYIPGQELGFIRQYEAERGAAGVIWSTWFDHFWQAKGAASYAASLLDLVGAQNLVEGNGAVPWAAGIGWGFVSAASQYFDTGLVPVNDQSWSVLFQYTNNALADRFLGKIRSGAPGGFFGISARIGANSVRYANGSTRTIAPRLDSGNLGVAGNQGYRDGVADGAVIAVLGGAFTHALPIGGRNLFGVYGNFCTAEIVAVGIKKGPALTAPQVAAAALAMSLI
jgi:hypothetical protein